jgi:acyl-CoA synthetase (AMP-forming)/AMP-acid ligase II
VHRASKLSGTRTDGPDSFVPVLNLSPEDRFGTALPLFHVYGQAVVLNTCLVIGCTLKPAVAVRAARDARAAAQGAAHGAGRVPTMWNAMLHAAEGFGRRLRRVAVGHLGWGLVAGGGDPGVLGHLRLHPCWRATG